MDPDLTRPDWRIVHTTCGCWTFGWRCRHRRQLDRWLAEQQQQERDRDRG